MYKLRIFAFVDMDSSLLVYNFDFLAFSQTLGSIVDLQRDPSMITSDLLDGSLQGWEECKGCSI